MTNATEDQNAQEIETGGTVATIGDNSDGIKENIQQMAADYAECDKDSGAINDKRKDIRDRAETLGIDKKAWQDEISRMKKSLRKKAGYDESVAVVRDALGDLDAEDLFSHVTRKDEEKKAAREAAKTLKEKEKRAAAKEEAKKKLA